MESEQQVAMTYDDISLVPQYSEIESRHNVSLEVELFSGEDRKIYLKNPIIGAPMDTVCGPEMCIALWNHGAIGVLHRYNTIEEQCELYKKVAGAEASCFVAVGATSSASRVSELYELGCRLFCIDVAHGNHIFVKNTIESMRAEYGNEIHIMAGNVCDYDGAMNLFEWGADSIRVGVGGGSVCSTRIVTGHGVPNLSALWDCVSARDDYILLNKITDNIPLVIADGGIRTSGDAAKAIGAGASMVMCGSLLAGTEESPPIVAERIAGYNGILEEIEYRGMASKDAQESNGRVSIVEGIATKIPYKGYVENVIREFRGGLQSALSYTGVDNIKDFQENVKFVVASNSSQIENQPHIKYQR